MDTKTGASILPTVLSIEDDPDSAAVAKAIFSTADDMFCSSLPGGSGGGAVRSVSLNPDIHPPRRVCRG